MRFNVQRKYDDLLEDNYRPPLLNRKDLLVWACEQHNAYLNKNGPQHHHLYDDCSNYAQLLNKYGPNYDVLKSKLGYVRGLFEDEQYT